MVSSHFLPGVPPKLDATHKAFLARIVEEGPIAPLPKLGRHNYIPSVTGKEGFKSCPHRHLSSLS